MAVAEVIVALAAATAVFLGAALVIEAAFPAEAAYGRGLGIAGLVFLVLAITFPNWPRRR